ncbi:hypothetical protein BT63DRAFT_419955 [Microthyrium microscopicum]|uniref:Uncharacterized protein n=1 Tax=Microthyrium microscopicum TaxID=703497 RepID=A0A6A6UT64_9PEZI|nr:hypothetical protein BT63DRAFT_419955 [Microthyrium microscopicum]
MASKATQDVVFRKDGFQGAANGPRPGGALQICTVTPIPPRRSTQLRPEAPFYVFKGEGKRTLMTL